MLSHMAQGGSRYDVLPTSGSIEFNEYSIMPSFRNTPAEIARALPESCPPILANISKPCKTGADFRGGAARHAGNMPVLRAQTVHLLHSISYLALHLGRYFRGTSGKLRRPPFSILLNIIDE